MNKENLNWPKRVILFDQEQYDGEWIPEKLEEAIDWLQDYLDQVPSENRKSSRIIVEGVSSYDCCYAQIDIYYDRPPTKEEKQERLDEEVMRDARASSKERAQYETLKKKFG